jgi:hypothetical protein
MHTASSDFLLSTSYFLFHLWPVRELHSCFDLLAVAQNDNVDAIAGLFFAERECEVVQRLDGHAGK